MERKKMKLNSLVRIDIGVMCWLGIGLNKNRQKSGMGKIEGVW